MPAICSNLTSVFNHGLVTLEEIQMTTLTATKHILVCDDDSDILELLNCLLVNAGYSVAVAHEHHEFMQRFHETKPDLILMDVHMPEHDGFWIAERLPTNERIPIIFITAHDRPVYRVCAPIVGAEDYIAKPFAPEDLLARIKKALQPTKRVSVRHFLDDL